MIYLDNAATTFPKPPEVVEQTFRWMREEGASPDRGTHAMSVASGSMVEKTRRAAAKLFGIPDFRQIIFTYNCTDAINIALKGWLHSGDHVITTALDHNAIARPLEHLRTHLGVSVTRVPFDSKGLVDPQSFEKNVSAQTKLMILTHGSNVLGTVQPLGEFIAVARRTRIPLLIDAAQTAGRIAIDVSDAPVMVACSAHKGLYGMPGLGILTVPRGVELARWREGGTGTSSESLNHPGELPARLEAGTPNFVGIAALGFGLSFIERESTKAIHSRENTLAQQLLAFLASDARFVTYTPVAAKERVAVVAFNVARAPSEEVAAILDQRFGIAVRAGLHCAATVHAQLGTSPGGCVRVSPGYFNQNAEIETLIGALKEIAAAY